MIRSPITIAMLISIVMHIALFLLAEWLIADAGEPAISVAIPVISVPSLRAGLDESARQIPDERKALKVADRPLHITVQQEAAIAGEGDAGAARAEKATAALHRLPASGLAHASSRIAEMSASKDAAISKPDVVNSTVARAPLAMSGVSRNDPPSFATAEISRRQEKMLQRKFREWTEHFHRMPAETRSMSWTYDGREYFAEFIHQAASDDMGVERVTVVISTEENGQRYSTGMRMKRLSFSNYAQFVNRWDDDVSMHDDALNGRFHSNTEITLAYSRKAKPQFHGQVTTSARSINFSETRGYVPREQIFLGGLQTGVKAIRLPEHFVPFPDDTEVSDDQVHRFVDDARITFHEDGSYDWQTIGSASPRQKVSIVGNTWFLIAGKSASLHVKGTVNGKVLVYSPQRIVIEGSLLYAGNPESTPDTDDYLGLASDKYVDVAPRHITGPGDLTIHAAIYAKRRFAVKDYRFRDSSTLHIYGSLTAGTLSATEPRYATRIVFDRRLEDMRPPRFPMTDRYAVESRDDNWKVEPEEL